MTTKVTKVSIYFVNISCANDIYFTHNEIFSFGLIIDRMVCHEFIHIYIIETMDQFDLIIVLNVCILLIRFTNDLTYKVVDYIDSL